MKCGSIQFLLLLSTTCVFWGTSGWAKTFEVSSKIGNSTMSAVFDAPFGERINAISSNLSCELEIDVSTGVAKGRCEIPLKTIMVDSEPTKTEHFYQWATNKKVDPAKCKLELFIKGKAKGPLKPMKAVAFSMMGKFKVCGRSHKNGKPETLEGNAILFPAGKYGAHETIRIRTRVGNFSRDDYQIGPGHTSGWLARVQSLASVVADKGEIHVNAFAVAKDSKKDTKKE